MKIARGWFVGNLFANALRNAELPSDVILWIDHCTATDKATNRKYIAIIYLDNERLPDMFYVTQWTHTKSEKPITTKSPGLPKVTTKTKATPKKKKEVKA